MDRCTPRAAATSAMVMAALASARISSARMPRDSVWEWGASALIEDSCPCPGVACWDIVLIKNAVFDYRTRLISMQGSMTMQFHHHGYVSGDPRVLPAEGTGIDRSAELPDEMDVL